MHESTLDHYSVDNRTFSDNKTSERERRRRRRGGWRKGGREKKGEVIDTDSHAQIVAPAFGSSAEESLSLHVNRPLEQRAQTERYSVPDKYAI